MARLRIGLALALLACALRPTQLHAHGGPPDITFWGPFPSGTAHCLRMMGRATQRCVRRVLALQHECMDAELAGQTCDQTLRDQRINAEKITARSVVSTECTGGQLTELHFIDPDDARTDITKTCTDQPNAVMSVAYAPAMPGGAAAALDETTSRCLVQTSMRSRALLRYIVRLKTRTLDLMAANVIGPAKKNTLLKRAADRITAAEAKLAPAILEMCPDFEALYGRSALAALQALNNPIGNCVVGAAYVQTSIACPPPICGNGVRESGEACDDGNTVDDDGCHNDCTTGQ
jgi:cysteine-rich repeat protein